MRSCPKENVVGGVNDGWRVAMTLLGFERGEAAATGPIRFQAEVDRLLLLAKERGVADDPVIRQRLAEAYAKVQVMRYNGMRVLTQFLKGHHPGPDAAISKLYWSEYHKVVTELAVDILGADALVPSGRHPSTAFSTDDAGAPNSSMSWVGDVPQRARRHDLRRLVADPAQHHRRDGARPAEGAATGVMPVHLSAVVGVVAGRPLWPTALRQLRAYGDDRVVAATAVPARAVTPTTCDSGWSRSTAIPSVPPVPGDVVDYLAWCRDWDRSLGR